MVGMEMYQVRHQELQLVQNSRIKMESYHLKIVVEIV